MPPSRRGRARRPRYSSDSPDAEEKQAAAEEALKLADRRYQHADERIAEAREQLETAQQDRDAARNVRWQERQSYERASVRVERLRKWIEEI